MISLRALALGLAVFLAVPAFAKTGPAPAPSTGDADRLYRGLTPDDIGRAAAAFVTDQGDWSMAVPPDRRAPETAAGEGSARRGHQ